MIKRTAAVVAGLSLLLLPTVAWCGPECDLVLSDCLYNMDRSGMDRDACFGQRNVCLAKHAERRAYAEAERSFLVLDANPPIAFQGSVVDLTIRAPEGFVDLLLAGGEKQERNRASVLVGGREAKVISKTDAGVRILVPEVEVGEPLIELRTGLFESSIAFGGLTVLPPVLEVVPLDAVPGDPATLITQWQIPERFHENLDVRIGNKMALILAFGKTSVEFEVPDNEPGSFEITYVIEGIPGSGGATIIELDASPPFLERYWILFFSLGIGIAGSGLAARSSWRRRAILPAQLHVTQTGEVSTATSRRAQQLIESTAPILLEWLRIENFKNIKRLELDLSRPSELEGNWTCIAGINGAGKSSILQATCILLLGERLAADLGSSRLPRFLRRDGDQTHPSRLEAGIRIGEEAVRLFMPLDHRGVDESTLRADPDYPLMKAVWERLRESLLVSYGAARNLSDREEQIHEDKAEQVQRQMTLFDPLTRISGADVLISGAKGSDRKVDTLKLLLDRIFDRENISLEQRANRVMFSQTGASVEAIDLPDGFRSTVAWLADLCSAWHDTAVDGRRSTDPAEITGIVLIDEIGLHLHPSLERSIVSQLRAALPKVQFIVTTHSPLVLSSFDLAELVVLESEPSGDIGVRHLDRQLFSFTTDEVYRWLMRTPPHSTVLERKAETGDDPHFAQYLFETGGSSEGSDGVDSAGAKTLLEDMEGLFEKLKESRRKK